MMRSRELREKERALARKGKGERRKKKRIGGQEKDQWSL